MKAHGPTGWEPTPKGKSRRGRRTVRVEYRVRPASGSTPGPWKRWYGHYKTRKDAENAVIGLRKSWSHFALRGLDSYEFRVAEEGR